MASEISSTNIALHGFTPVRRRESTVNTRQFHGDQEKEWTAARCHRLLRALTSRVAILNKELGRLSQPGQSQDRNNGEAPKTAKSSRTNTRDDDEDNDWTRPRKKVKRTYSTRTGRKGAGRDIPKTPRLLSKGRKSLGSGDILIPTPILARARGEHYVDEHPSMIANSGFHDQNLGRTKRSRHHYMTNDGEPCFQLSGTLRDLRRKVNASRYTIYEGIYNGLEALLRSTMDDEPEVKRKGARSLFSTALIAVPDYIAEEEEAHFEEIGTKSAINARDITTEIYDELENFGSSGHGWKKLKTVVRSHGMKVLGDAITAGLLDVEFCGVLITLCIHTFAAEEAEILLSSMLYSGRFQTPKTLYDIAPRPFSMLWKFVEYTGRFAFQYHQLASLISNGILPLGWLATKEFRPVWTGVVQRLSPGAVNSDALFFLEISLPLLAGSGRSSTVFDTTSLVTVKHTFTSLITTLLSIVLLSQQSLDSNTNEEPRESDTPYEHVRTLLQRCVIQCNLSQTSNSQGVLLLAANMLAREQLSKYENSEEALVTLLRNQEWDNDDDSDVGSEGYNDLIAFICSVARCCGRGASSVGFEYLEYLHLTLTKLSVDCRGADIFQGVIVDSAFAFAQQLPEQAHINYASAMDVKFCARNVKYGMAPISEADNVTRPGFRWEEGIGEWVTATPAGNNSKRQRIAPYPMKRGAECISPFRPPSWSRQTKAKGIALAKKQSLQSSNLSIESEINLNVLSSPGSASEPRHYEQDFAASDDELNAIHSSASEVSEDEPEYRDSPSDIETSFTESSVCSGTQYNGEAENKEIRLSIDRAPRSSRRLLQHSQDWQLFDESFSSTGSSSTSNQSRVSDSRRQYVDRAPRLGRRALRSSQVWQLFDESDDELSFNSVSSQTDHILGDITNTATNESRRARKIKAPIKQQKPMTNWTALLSEDELGM